MINLRSTKDELARRRAQKKGVSYNQTNLTQLRWSRRLKDDEQFAKSLGINLRYDDTRRGR